jgi:hypothetical protein
MRFEFFQDTESLGSATWMGPGQVRLDVPDPARRDEMDRYFAAEAVYLTAGFDQLHDGEGVASRRRDWTPWEFRRACVNLALSRRYTLVSRPVGPVEDRPEEGG